MIDERETAELHCTPTDPSLEFDVFELTRQRLVEAFIAGGRTRLDAERIALYVVRGAQPVARFLKVLTRVKPPTHEEVLDALGPVLDEAVALEKAKQLLLRMEIEAQG